MFTHELLGTNGRQTCRLLKINALSILVDPYIDHCASAREPLAVAEAHGRFFDVRQLGAKLIGTIDLVLVSNTDAYLAIPYLCDRRYGFAGLVYCTEPVLTLGMLQIQDLVQSIHRERAFSVQSGHVPSSNSTPYPTLADFAYSPQQIASCLAKTKALSYRQRVSVQNTVTITPHASGAQLYGSCYWTLQQTGSSPVAICSQMGSLSASNTSTALSLSLDGFRGSAAAFLPSTIPATSLKDNGSNAAGHKLRSTKEADVVEPLHDLDEKGWAGQVSRLRKVLGLTLFERSTSLVIPYTPYGSVLDTLSALSSILYKPAAATEAPGPAELSKKEKGKRKMLAADLAPRIKTYLVCSYADDALKAIKLHFDYLSARLAASVFVPQTPLHFEEYIASRDIVLVDTVHGLMVSKDTEPAVYLIPELCFSLNGADLFHLSKKLAALGHRHCRLILDPHQQPPLRTASHKHGPSSELHISNNHAISNEIKSEFNNEAGSDHRSKRRRKADRLLQHNKSFATDLEPHVVYSPLGSLLSVCDLLEVFKAASNPNFLAFVSEQCFNADTALLNAMPLSENVLVVHARAAIDIQDRIGTNGPAYQPARLAPASWAAPGPNRVQISSQFHEHQATLVGGPVSYGTLDLPHTIAEIQRVFPTASFQVLHNDPTYKYRTQIASAGLEVLISASQVHMAIQSSDNKPETICKAYQAICEIILPQLLIATPFL